MILADTSAIYALADRGDANHTAAVRTLATLESAGEEFLTHTYVLLETFALLHRRHGLAPAIRVSQDMAKFKTVTVDRALHDEAVEWLRRHPGAAPSLVDAVSFAVMRRAGLREAFAFDPDFAKAGFRLCGSGPAD